MTTTLTETDTCYSCGETVTTDGTDDTRWANLAEGWQCWPCYESDEAHATTLIHLSPEYDGGILKVLWATGHAMDLEYGEDINPLEEWPGLSERWQSTDAWRGYSVISCPDGWDVLDEGAALWGEHTRVHDVATDLVEQVTLTGEPLDREYLIVWAPTSNVFSMTVDIFVKSEES